MYFKKEKKKDILQGRSTRFVAREILDINECYLSMVFNNHKSCSLKLARKITQLVPEAKIEDFFTKGK